MAGLIDSATALFCVGDHQARHVSGELRWSCSSSSFSAVSRLPAKTRLRYIISNYSSTALNERLLRKLENAPI